MDLDLEEDPISEEISYPPTSGNHARSPDPRLEVEASSRSDEDKGRTLPNPSRRRGSSREDSSTLQISPASGTRPSKQEASSRKPANHGSRRSHSRESADIGITPQPRGSPDIQMTSTKTRPRNYKDRKVNGTSQESVGRRNNDLEHRIKSRRSASASNRPKAGSDPIGTFRLRYARFGNFSISDETSSLGIELFISADIGKLGIEIIGRKISNADKQSFVRTMALTNEVGVADDSLRLHPAANSSGPGSGPDAYLEFHQLEEVVSFCTAIQKHTPRVRIYKSILSKVRDPRRPLFDHEPSSRSLEEVETATETRVRSESYEDDDQSLPSVTQLVGGNRRTTRSSTRLKEPAINAFDEQFPKRNIFAGITRPRRWEVPLLFPPDGPKKVPLDFDDLEKLGDNEFLNDSLITFYIRYLEKKHLESAQVNAPKVYFFNTHFYNKLSNPQNKRGILYESVKRWVKVDIFDYDFLIMPVNENLHWYLVIISNPRELVLPRSREVTINPEPELSLTSRVEDESKDQKHGRMSSVRDENAATSRPELEEPMVEAQETGVERNMSFISLDENAETTDASLGPTKSVLQTQSTVLGLEAGPELVNNDDIESLPGGPRSPGKTVRSIDELTTPSLKKPKKRTMPTRSVGEPDSCLLLVLDSLPGNKQEGARGKIRAYLREEALAKRQVAVDPSLIRGGLCTNIPQQTNYSDCGVFLLSYIEQLLADPPSVSKHLALRSATPGPFRSIDAFHYRRSILRVILNLYWSSVNPGVPSEQTPISAPIRPSSKELIHSQPSEVECQIFRETVRPRLTDDPAEPVSTTLSGKNAAEETAVQSIDDAPAEKHESSIERSDQQDNLSARATSPPLDVLLENPLRAINDSPPSPVPSQDSVLHQSHSTLEASITYSREQTASLGESETTSVPKPMIESASPPALQMAVDDFTGFSHSPRPSEQTEIVLNDDHDLEQCEIQQAPSSEFEVCSRPWSTVQVEGEMQQRAPTSPSIEERRSNRSLPGKQAAMRSEVRPANLVTVLDKHSSSEEASSIPTTQGMRPGRRISSTASDSCVMIGTQGTPNLGKRGRKAKNRCEMGSFHRQDSDNAHRNTDNAGQNKRQKRTKSAQRPGVSTGNARSHRPPPRRTAPKPKPAVKASRRPSAIVDLAGSADELAKPAPSPFVEVEVRGCRERNAYSDITAKKKGSKPAMEQRDGPFISDSKPSSNSDQSLTTGSTAGPSIDAKDRTKKRPPPSNAEWDLRREISARGSSNSTVNGAIVIEDEPDRSDEPNKADRPWAGPGRSFKRRMMETDEPGEPDEPDAWDQEIESRILDPNCNGFS